MQRKIFVSVGDYVTGYCTRLPEEECGVFILH